MHLRYTDSNSGVVQFELTEEPVIIGRSDDADVKICDDEASRFHASIIFWYGDYVVKDLKTANGTSLDNSSIDVAVLVPNSILRIGSTDIVFEDEIPENVGRGPNTILRKVSMEMEEGKGYKTIMKEIIRDVDTKKKDN